jgi:hypothetical protein
MIRIDVVNPALAWILAVPALRSRWMGPRKPLGLTVPPSVLALADEVIE